MKVLGIVAAKENSTRFKDKNIHQVNGLPMFMHAVNALKDIADFTVVDTDSEIIIKYCSDNYIFHHKRRPRICGDNVPVYKVIKYTYTVIKDLELELYLTDPDYIIFILANSINHTQKDVQNALELAVKHNLKEVRSYDKNGVENGIVVLYKSVLENYDYISAYMGAITTDGKEIHYKIDI